MLSEGKGYIKGYWEIMSFRNTKHSACITSKFKSQLSHLSPSPEIAAANVNVSGRHNRITALQHEEQPCCFCYLTSAANSMDPSRSMTKRENSCRVSFSPPWGGRKLSWEKRLEFSTKILTESKLGTDL